MPEQALKSAHDAAVLVANMLEMDPDVIIAGADNGGVVHVVLGDACTFTVAVTGFRPAPQRADKPFPVPFPDDDADDDAAEGDA